MKTTIVLPIVVILGVGIVAAFLLTNYIEQPTINQEETSNITSTLNEEKTNTETSNEDKTITKTSNFTKIASTQDEYEFNLENSINAKLMPDKPINKEVISGTVFGFTVDNGLQGGMEYQRLSKMEEKFSIRFTSKFDGELETIKLYLEGQEQTSYKIGLQEDNNGIPSGIWIGDSPGYKVATLDLGKHEQTINLIDGIILTEGAVYHIVIELEENLGGYFMVLTYQSNWPLTPFNYKDPDEVWSDEAINTLQFDGNEWETLERWPTFVISYSDGITDGQPYTLMAPWVITGSSEVGQTIRPFSNYLVDEFAFVVSADGNPKDDLYYEVLDDNNNILRNGTFAAPTDLTIRKSWQQVNLDSPLNLNSGDIYRFILSSPGTDLKNAYKVYGHEFMLDRTLGYGSVNHHLTKSTDGKNWNKWYDADAVFKLITK